MEFLLLSLVMVAFGVLAITANELGVDSREESDDPHRPFYPVEMS
jgi:hypothetical protein